MQTVRVIAVTLGAIALMWSIRAACGRLTGKIALAPLLFLVSRRPVLVTWVVGAVAMFVFISQSAAANGKDPSMWLLVGVSLFSGLGCAALFVGPVFMIMRSSAPLPQVDLLHGETIEATIAAVHMLKNEGRGGTVLITNQRLAFRPNRFNVQLEPWSVRLDEIRGVASEGMRLVLVDTDERQEILVAQSPARLVAQIRERLTSGNQPENPGA